MFNFDDIPVTEGTRNACGAGWKSVEPTVTMDRVYFDAIKREFARLRGAALEANDMAKALAQCPDAVKLFEAVVNRVSELGDIMATIDFSDDYCTIRVIPYDDEEEQEDE